MYNREYKEEYLEILSRASDAPQTLINDTKQLFDQSGETEEKKGRDLYDFSTDDLSELFRKIGRDTYSKIGSSLGSYKRYVEHSLEAGVASPDAVRDFSRQSYVSLIRAGEAIGRDELMDVARELTNPMAAVIVLGLFEGLTKAELVGLTREHIHDTYVETQSRTLEMSSLFIQKAREACDADFLLPITEDQKTIEKKAKSRGFLNSDACIKATRRGTSGDTTQRIHVRLALLREALPGIGPMLSQDRFRYPSIPMMRIKFLKALEKGA